MANFKLNCQLNINGPANMRAITQQIQRQLSSINANVNFKINPSATRNVNNLNTAAGKLNVTLQALTRSANQAVPAINNLASALASNAGNIKTIAQSAQGLQKNLQAVQKTTQQVTNSMESLGKQAANAIKRYAAFSIAAGGIYELAAAIKSGFKEALDFQNEMVKLSQVTGSSVKSLSGLSDEVTRLSTTLGISSKTLLNASQTLAQAGFTAKEVKVGLEALAKTELAPTFKNIENTTEGAIAAMKQFDIEIKDLEGTLGSINSVSAQFAVESDDLVTAIRRSGSAFKAAGGNLEEFIALFTSVRQTTRESAETIATGFRTIFTRIQRPATLNYFKSLGVELTDAKGNFIGAYEAVRRLSSALQGIESTDPRFAKIVEELGGFRQVSKVIPLLQQFAVSEKALGVAIRGRASLSKDAETAQESLLRQLVKVKEEFAELFRTIINDSSFRSIIDITILATKSFIDLAKAATPLIPILTGLFAIKAGSGLGSFAKGFSGAFGTKKFARGGVVPGQGNGDTVPALLTPGEFVIRKDAAQTIGYDKLHKVNKYKSGGIVKKGSLINASDNERTFGAIALEPGDVPPGVKGVSISIDQLFKKDEKRKYKFTASQLNAREPISIIADSVYKKNGESNELLKSFKEKLVGDINNIGDYLGKKLGVTERTPITASSIPNYDSIVGGVFEGAIASIGNPYDNKGESSDFDNNKTFDFPQGVNFNKAMVSLPVDAKKKLSESAIRDVRKKAANYYRQKGLVKPELFKEKISANQAVGKDKLGKDRFIEDFQKLSSGQSLDAGKYFAGKSAAKEAKSALSALNIQFGSAKNKIRRADGGSIPGQGTDTVPAMLTPGEFVINKESAQRIGYGNLNQMNKVQKFASGGVVKFANGGKAPVSSGDDGFAKFYALGTVLPGIIAQFGELGDTARELAGAFGSAIGIFAVMKPQLKQFENNIQQIGTKISSSSKVLDARKQKDIQSLTDRKNYEFTQIQQINQSRLDKVKNAYQIGGYTRQQAKDAVDLINQQNQSQLKASNSRFKQGLSDIDVNYQDRANNRLSRSQRRFGRLQSIQRSEKIGTVFGIGGAIAGVAGGSISNFAQKDIRNNQGLNQLGGTLAGAGNGAAIGAAVGSVIPIIGTAFGAVAGALIGGATSFFSSAEETKRMIEQLDFNESFDSLEKSLNDVASGKVTLSSQSSNISSRLSQTRASFFSADADLRKESFNKAAGQASNFENILSKFISTAKSLDDVKKASGGLGEELIQILSELNNTPVSELENSIEKQIKANNKQADLQQKMADAMALSENAFLELKNSTAGIVESFRTASESVDHLGAAFDSAFTRIGSSNVSASSVRLDSAGLRDFGNTRDTSRLSSAIQPLLTPLGSGGAAFAKEAVNISKGIKELPNILQSVSNANFLDPQRFTAVLGNELGKFGNTFRDIVVGNAGGIINKEQGETEIFNKLKTDPKALAEELTREFEFLPKALEEANKMLEENLNNYAKRASQISELELTIREENVKNIQLGFEKTSRLRELRGQSVSSEEVIGNINAQRNARTGGQNALTANLSKIQKEIYDNEQKILKGDKELIPVTESLKVKLASLTSVIKDTATNFDKVNAIISDIKKEQGLRQFKQNTLDDFIYGDTESRTRTIQSVAATNAVANGADLESIHPEIRQSIKSFVDSLPDDFKFNVLGGRTKKEFQDEQRTKALKSAGVSDEEIAKINTATPKEEKLYAELDKAFNEMETAQQKFQDFLSGQKDALSAALTDSNKIFENSLKTMFLSEQKKSQEDIVAKSNLEMELATNKLDAISKLPGSDIEGARRYVSGKDEFLQIQKDEEKANRLNSILSGKSVLSADLGDKKIETGADFRTALSSSANTAQALSLGIPFEKYAAAVAKSADKFDVYGKDFFGGQAVKINPQQEFNNIIKSLIKDQASELDASILNRKKDFKSKYGSGFDTYSVDEATKQEAILRQIGDSTVDTIQSTMNRLTETLKSASEKISEINSQLPQTQNKARGGIVYANRGMFVPKGTDTVPAMLTPGEFVVNAKSAQKHRGLLEQINTQYKAAGGVIQDPITKLWKATGGARLTQQQQKENLILRGKKEREKIFDSNIGIATNNLINRDLTTLPTNEGILSQPRIKSKLKTQSKLDSAALSRNYAYSNNPLLKELGKQRDVARAEKARINTGEDTVRSRTLAAIELIKKENKANGPNINGVAYVSKAERDRQADIKLKAETGMLNFNNQMLAAKYANTTINTDTSTQKKYDNGLDSRINASANEARAKSQADEAIYRENNPLTATTGRRGYFDVIRDRKIQEEKFVPLPRMKGYAEGGSVDSVPAMLTPGEFVLNKNATSRAGVNNLQRFNKGGPVNYLSGGGTASGGAMPTMDTGALTAAINIFNTSANALASALKSIPTSISLEANMKPVEVIINGAEVLSQLQQPLQELIAQKINEGVSNLLKDKFPGAGLANNVVS